MLVQHSKMTLGINTWDASILVQYLEVTLSMFERAIPRTRYLPVVLLQPRLKFTPTPLQPWFYLKTVSASGRDQTPVCSGLISGIRILPTFSTTKVCYTNLPKVSKCPFNLLIRPSALCSMRMDLYSSVYDVGPLAQYYPSDSISLELEHYQVLDLVCVYSKRSQNYKKFDKNCFLYCTLVRNVSHKI